MKPWRAEGDVPTAANLNLNRGWHSRVGWHSDDEPLFGERWETKLIVSVSFGTPALFKWKGKSCPDGEAGLCCLGHGDILAMDVQCQDEFRHCTDSGLEQERIDVTFRWTRQHTASCPLRTGAVCWLPTCAQGSSAAVTRVVEARRFLGILGAPWSLVYMEALALLVKPSCVYRTKGCPFWEQVLWHLWVGRARYPGPSNSHLAVEVFHVWRWRTRGDLVLEAQVDFVAVVEHGLIPARVRGGPGFGVRVWQLFGRLPPRNLLMLVMLVLGSLARGPLFLCLPLPLLSLSASLTMVELSGACCL